MKSGYLRQASMILTPRTFLAQAPSRFNDSSILKPFHPSCSVRVFFDTFQCHSRNAWRFRYVEATAYVVVYKEAFLVDICKCISAR